jgi:anti-sigma factor RsiW
MHPDIDVLLSYADGQLSPTDVRKLEKHLEECGECRLEARRIRASAIPGPPTSAASEDVLAGIRNWSAKRSQGQDPGIKERVAAELDPYLGAAGSAAVMGRVSADGEHLLSAVEDVLTDFLGRRAVGALVDRIVEHTIMRS